MYNQNQGGYYPQPAAPRGQQKQKTEVINKCEYTGIVKPLSKNENDPIRFYPFQNGGGVVHFIIRVTEPVIDSNGQPKYDEQGNAKVVVTSIRVDVRTNSKITPEVLGSIVPGMKVHVVGHTRHSFYKDPKSGKDMRNEVCEAYVFDVLALPMETPYGAMPQYAQPQSVPQGYQQPYPQQQPYYPPQPGYAPQPQFAQPQYPPQGYQQPYPRQQVQNPQYAQPQAQNYQQPAAQPQAQQQPAYQRQPQQVQSQRMQQQAPMPPTPPYYQPGTGAAQANPNEDMPEEICDPVKAPGVKDINI